MGKVYLLGVLSYNKLVGFKVLAHNLSSFLREVQRQHTGVGSSSQKELESEGGGVTVGTACKESHGVSLVWVGKATLSSTCYLPPTTYYPVLTTYTYLLPDGY